MKKSLIFLFTLCLFCFLTLPSFANESADIDLEKMRELIPKEALEKLPDDLFSGTVNTSTFSFSYFISLLRDILSSLGADFTTSLSSTVSLVIIASLFHFLAQTQKGGLCESFSGISSLCISIYVFTSISLLFKSVRTYLATISSFSNAMTPFITIAYTLGGNVSSTAVSTTGLMLCITFIESINAYMLYPILKISSILTIATATSPKLRIGSLSKFIRGFLLLAIGLTVAAISAIMTFQHTLSSAADSLTARTVRFAASNFIPIVGSAISDAVRTVGSSVSYIRTTVGGVGIAVIVVLTLPVFLSLMLSRINLAISASLADMLMCEREKNALKEAGGLVNFLIALVSLTAVMFVYYLTLLIRCTSAFGG